MSSNIVNQVPYLRAQRKFPQDIQPLVVELDRAYVDIASSVNNRTISLFVQGSPVINGESWFISSQRQQGFRRFYTITGPGSIAHGINTSTIYGFTKIYGTFSTSGGTWYPLPYVDAIAANNQISLSVTSTNIVITAGGGSPPTIAKGFVVLEWLAFS